MTAASSQDSPKNIRSPKYSITQLATYGPQGLPFSLLFKPRCVYCWTHSLHLETGRCINKVASVFNKVYPQYGPQTCLCEHGFTFICKMYNLKLCWNMKCSWLGKHPEYYNFRLKKKTALLETLKPNPDLSGSFMPKLLTLHPKSQTELTGY